MSENLATFGAGCFWGVEARFRAQPGVQEAVSGYMGGELDDPGYRAVCTGRTGHAEVVQVTFDPNVVRYPRLLALFFSLHDPTTLNRQGPDIGTQYRSVIFTHDEEQADQARRAVAALDASGRFTRPIVTEVAPAASFWRAEDYHQRYLEKNHGGFCHLGDNRITISDLGLE
jgi:peptide-methionine (S)-S-oxide reductase